MFQLPLADDDCPLQQLGDRSRDEARDEVADGGDDEQGQGRRAPDRVVGQLHARPHFGVVPGQDGPFFLFYLLDQRPDLLHDVLAGALGDESRGRFQAFLPLFGHAKVDALLKDVEPLPDQRLQFVQPLPLGRVGRPFSEVVDLRFPGLLVGPERLQKGFVLRKQVAALLGFGVFQGDD